VFLQAVDEQLATQLRVDFGNTIDVEYRNKRLAGGPAGLTDSCLLTKPVWALGGPLPSGVTTRVLRPAIPPTRKAPFNLGLEVTNRSRSTIRVAFEERDPLCPTAQIPGVVLATPDGPAANVGLGAQIGGWDLLQQPQSVGIEGGIEGDIEGGGKRFVLNGQGGPLQLEPFYSLSSCTQHKVVSIRPGRSTTVNLLVSTLSQQPGPDPHLVAGEYLARPVIQIQANTRQGTPWHTVAATPQGITLAD
jgi:hypothetical protein